MGRLPEEIFNTAKIGDSNCEARFRDFETLKYVFRSIELYAPWVRNIHLVTAGHLPPWLQASHPILRIHTHQEIFSNTEHLPTFNSNAIEMNIINIPGLAEKFVLFNDDTLLLRRTDPTTYFKDGFPCDFLIQNSIKGILLRVLRRKSIWSQSLWMNIRLINDSYDKGESIRKNRGKYVHKDYGLWGIIRNLMANTSGKFLYFEHHHHPQPYLKETWERARIRYRDVINRTSAHRFRTSEDIVHYFFRYMHLVEGRFSPRTARGFKTFSISSVADAKRCARMMSKSASACINDTPELSSADFPFAKREVLDALGYLLPHKSSFET
jgi:hypothetical protein